MSQDFTPRTPVAHSSQKTMLLFSVNRLKYSIRSEDGDALQPSPKEEQEVLLESRNSLEPSLSLSLFST